MAIFFTIDLPPLLPTPHANNHLHARRIGNIPLPRRTSTNLDYPIASFNGIPAPEGGEETQAP